MNYNAIRPARDRAAATREGHRRAKIDRLPEAQRPPRIVAARVNGDSTAPSVVAVSALTGEGLPELLDLIEQRVVGDRRTYAVELAGAALGHGD